MPTLPILFKNMVGGIGGATLPAPDRYLTSRSGLTLADEIGSADAGIVKFPCVNMLASGSAYSRFETGYNTVESGDFSVFMLFKRKSGVAESRPSVRNSNYNMNSLGYVRDSVTSNFGNPLYVPPSHPSMDWDEVHIFGLKYDQSENNISSYWNEDLETVSQSLSTSQAYAFVSTAANYSDIQVLGIFGYSKLISEAEMTNIRINGVFPQGDELYIYPFTNSDDDIWIEQFDAVNRLGGNSYYHGWLTSGSTILPPSDAFSDRVDDLPAAYNLLYGFSQQGVHQMPYKPDGTKGNGGEDGDIEHPSSGVIHNLADSYIDGNPDDHTMDWGTDADKVYAVFDKSNRTLWKASIETANGGKHYVQNGDGNYTLWHPDEMNEDFVNEHAETGHAGHLFFGLRTSGANVTGITKIAVYKENQT